MPQIAKRLASEAFNGDIDTEVVPRPSQPVVAVELPAPRTLDVVVTEGAFAESKLPSSIEKGVKPDVELSQPKDTGKIDSSTENMVLAEVGNGWRCPICWADVGKWWPCIRVPIADCEPGLLQRCHFHCVKAILERTPSGDPCMSDENAQWPGMVIEPAFVKELRQVLVLCPDLLRKKPQLSFAMEELRLTMAAEEWPPPEVPHVPAATFTFEGTPELRISSCPSLTQLPKDIGFFYSLRSLVLISNSLLEMPAEVGYLRELERLYLNGNFLRTLPTEVGALPVLKEICLDSNRLEALPPLLSPQLMMLTAPANRLKELPFMCGRLDRLEVYGNQLLSASLLYPQAQWDKMQSLKLMGNRLRALPEALGQMVQMRILSISGNQLESLPEGIAKLWRLQWVFAYSNCIQELPERFLFCSKHLDRVMLEDNPLTHYTLKQLFYDARRKDFLSNLSLDLEQVRRYTEAEGVLWEDRNPPGGDPAYYSGWKSLPWCASVGSIICKDIAHEYFMKLYRASQMKRTSGLAVGEWNGPVPPDEEPAELLVVAFAASQGEPEWLGILRKLADLGKARLSPAPSGSLESLVSDVAGLAGGQETAEKITSILWSECCRGINGTASAQTQAEVTDEISEEVCFADFDVLAVVDQHMTWYRDPSGGFAANLKRITSRYRRTLFVGASMGGFGAMLHGGRLADAVIAFAPQGRVDQASLRPPAEDSEALKARHTELCESIRGASARGATIEVHCAADEHCYHALSLPLGDHCLTVHPMLPRKPFARILERAGLLEPIMSDAICRVLLNKPRTLAQVSERPLDDPWILLARWGRQGQGRHTCHWTTRQSILRLFFSKGMPYMPRPGEWFCAKCLKRNSCAQFFCFMCSGKFEESRGPSIADEDAIKIPGSLYPKSGDWGCGDCLAANCAYQQTCGSCGKDQADHPATVFAK